MVAVIPVEAGETPETWPVERTGPAAEVAGTYVSRNQRADTDEIPRVIEEPVLRPPVEPERVEEDTVPAFGFAPPGAPLILPPVEAGPDDAAGRGRSPLTPAARKAQQRRRLVVLIAFVLLAVIVLLIGQFVRSDDGRRIAGGPVASAVPAAGIGEPATQPNAGPAAGSPTGTGGTTAATSRAAGPATATSASRPSDTANRAPARAAGAATGFSFVAGFGPVLGTEGTLRRFKVSVEKTLGQGNGGDFADEIDRTLGDERGWIAARQFRLQRVPPNAASEFTIYLASAKTAERMCDAGGLNTGGYSSCRLPGQVVINNTRWQDAVPDYEAPLETYRAYTINHEVGHQLGQGHEGCPGKGRPAPVMMQQTYGLQGCVANAWPYIGGKRYSGPIVS